MRVRRAKLRGLYDAERALWLSETSMERRRDELERQSLMRKEQKAQEARELEERARCEASPELRLLRSLVKKAVVPVRVPVEPVRVPEVPPQQEQPLPWVLRLSCAPCDNAPSLSTPHRRKELDAALKAICGDVRLRQVDLRAAPGNRFGLDLTVDAARVPEGRLLGMRFDVTIVEGLKVKPPLVAWLDEGVDAKNAARAAASANEALVARQREAERQAQVLLHQQMAKEEEKKQRQLLHDLKERADIEEDARKAARVAEVALERLALDVLEPAETVKKRVDFDFQPPPAPDLEEVEITEHPPFWDDHDARDEYRRQAAARLRDEVVESWAYRRDPPKDEAPIVDDAQVRAAVWAAQQARVRAAQLLANEHRAASIVAAAKRADERAADIALARDRDKRHRDWLRAHTPHNLPPHLAAKLPEAMRPATPGGPSYADIQRDNHFRLAAGRPLTPAAVQARRLASP